MILCCGEALIDLFQADGFKPMPGGSPFNTAIAIGKMGVPVRFLGRFSKDFFGEVLVKRLKDSKVSEELIIRSDQNTTLAFVKPEKGKDPQYIFYAEGTASCSLTVDDLPKKLPPETHCIVFGSIAMTVEPIATAIDTLITREVSLQSLGKDGPVISFDPNIRPYMVQDKKAYIKQLERWIAASTIAKVSAVDFEYIYPGMPLEKALPKVLSMGPRIAICTQGVKGAEAMLRRNDGSVIKVTAPTVNLPVVDTIGAGDTFHGAFLSWLEVNGKLSRSGIISLTEDDIYNALYFANKAASIVCTRQGAEPPTKREVDALKAPAVSAGSSAKTAKAAPVSKKAVAAKTAAPAKKKKP